MKKTLVTTLIIVVIIISGLIFLNKNKNETTGTGNNCVKEGEKSYGEAPVIYQCCSGLKMIGAIDDNNITTYDVAYCTKCGDNNCKKPENKYNCPEDCK